jgi:hypothetical protein
MSLKKGIRILRDHGIKKFIKRFFIFLFQNIFTYKTYNFYKKSLNDSENVDLELKGRDPTLIIIHLSSELDNLIQNGFNFGPYQDLYDIRKLLNEGAILFCVFFGKNWAHSSWASIDNGSSIDPFFGKLQDQNGGYIGTCSTNPDCRGLGLYPYVLSKICEFFEIRGKTSALISTAKNNAPSIKGISKVGFFIYSDGYNLNLAGCKFWVVNEP